MASDIGHLTRRAFVEVVAGIAAMVVASPLSLAEPSNLSVRPNAKEWFSAWEIHKFLKMMSGAHSFKSAKPERDKYRESWENFVARVRQHQPNASDVQFQVDRFKKNYEGRYKVLGLPIEQVPGFNNDYLVEARGFPILSPGESRDGVEYDLLLPLGYVPNLKTPLENTEVSVSVSDPFFKWYPNYKSLFILQVDPDNAEKVQKEFGDTLFYGYEFTLRIDCNIGHYEGFVSIPGHEARPLVRRGILHPGNHQDWAGAQDWVGMQEYPLPVQLLGCTTQMHYTIDRMILYLHDTPPPSTAYERIHGVAPLRALPSKGIILDKRA